VNPANDKINKVCRCYLFTFLNQTPTIDLVCGLLRNEGQTPPRHKSKRD
jgi:hypothetical protein